MFSGSFTDLKGRIRIQLGIQEVSDTVFLEKFLKQLNKKKKKTNYNFKK